jgi:hypothetical protein
MRTSVVTFKQELVVATLLLNLKTCFYGNQVTALFSSVDTPTCFEYFRAANDGTLLKFFENM